MPNVVGVMPLSRMQAGFELAHGTAVAATRRVYIMSGTMKESQEVTFPQEQRSSFIANYRGFANKQWVEMSGLEIAPSFEDMPWWLNLVVSPQTTGTPTAISAWRYDFVPSVGSNNLKSATFECYSDTQNYQVNGVVATRMEFGITRNGPATMSVDLIGNAATATSVTSNIADRTVEDINGGLAQAYIDTTTIGSTAVTNVLDFKVTVDTGYQHMFALGGALTPADVYRGATRKASVEATLAFQNTTEYALWKSSSTGATVRKIRVTIPGTAIAGTTPATTKSLTMDMYTVWEEAPFGEQDGLKVVNFKGQTVFDSTAGHDFKFSVVNSLSSLP